MQPVTDILLQKKTDKIYLYLIGIVIFFGILILCGWYLEIDVLKSPLPGLAPVNPMSAVSFILCGFSLLLIDKHNRLYRLGILIAILVFLIALIRLIEIFFNYHPLNIDQWLFASKLIAGNYTSHMAPNSAINFALAGVALLLINYETKRKKAPSQFIAALITLTSLFSLLGYVYRAKEFDAIMNYLPMAVHTSIGFLFLSIAMLFKYPQRGIIKDFVTPYAGSSVGRRLILFAVFVPVVLGYLRLLGGWYNQYSTEFGVTILVLSIVITFACFIIYITKRLNKKDELKLDAEEELRTSQKIFATIFYKSPAMNVISDAATSQFIDINDSYAHFFGFRKEEVIGKTAQELGILANPDERAKLLQELTTYGSVKDKAIKLRLKDGQVRWVSINMDCLMLNGRQCYISTMSDITNVKKGEEKFRNLLEVAPDAVIIVDKKGLIKLINAQTELMFGYNREELLEQQLEMLIPARFRATHPHYRDKFFESPRTRGMGIGLELYGLKKNGEEFPVEISLSPLETEEGMLVSAAIRDISERKKAEEKFRNLLESAPDAIIIVNEQGIIQLVNVQTEQLFGYLRGEIIGQPVELLMPFRFNKPHKVHREEFFKSPKVRPMGEGRELFGKKKSGDEFPIEISLSPLETEEGLLVSAAIRDITEKKQMERQIKEVNIDLERKVKQRTEELEIKNKDLEQFAYVASHDLQEPLRTTSSFVEMFKSKYEGQLDEDADIMLKYILQSSERMKILIKDLLDYSRIGRKTEIGEVNCNQVIEDVLADLSAFIQETGAKITVEQLPTLKGYETELKLLFQNLIINAIKFRKKDISPLIYIDAEKKKDHWEFIVADNGIGIEEKHKERIFVIFQRLHTRSEYEGSGIGLSHCKKIAELHQGKIWVDSEYGKGCVFHFTIHEM